MAPFASIYTYPNNLRLMRTYAAAKVNDLEIVEIPDFKMQQTNKTPEFLAKFPLGKVPALETPTGFAICETGAIAHFVADSGPKRDQLLGATPEERGKIQQWIQHDTHELSTNVATGMRVRMGFAQYNEAKEAEALEKVNKIARALEDTLKKNEWIAGTKDFSLADLTIAATVYAGNKLWFGKEWREEFPALMAHLEKVQNLPKVGEVYPKIAFKESSVYVKQ